MKFILNNNKNTAKGIKLQILLIVLINLFAYS